MIRVSVFVIAIAAAASADPYAGWDTVQPRSKTARLDVQRLAITSALRLVALDARGPVVDDGTATSRPVDGKLVELTPGATKQPVYWWRGPKLMALDGDHVSAVGTPTPASDGHSVVLGGVIYYVAGDKLVRFDPKQPSATSVADVGREYEGAIATDGKKVFVADRDSLWSYDPASDRRTTLPQELYWPGELAFHDGRFLIDIHGHGAAVFRASDKSTISLGTSLANPSGEVGWSGDNAIVVETHAPLAAGSDDSNDNADADAADAITCWRAAREPGDRQHGVLHTLYRTAPGVHVCDVRIRAGSIAWLEYRGDEYCASPEALVTARVVGSCE